MKEIYFCFAYYKYKEDWITKKPNDEAMDKHWVIVHLHLAWTFLYAKNYLNL